MVTGPATPPRGTGSANLIVDSTGGMIIARSGNQGVRFSAITNLQYSTYRTSGGSLFAPALQFTVDMDANDANTAFQGRIVFEPFTAGAVQTGVWQTWNPMSQGGWWFTRAPQNATCSQADTCTWSEVLTLFPNIAIHPTDPGSMIFKAGGGWTGGFNGNVDAFTIGVNGDNTTYDFEAAAPPPPLVGPPTNKDQCKNGGWQTFNNPSFRNQGDCVSFVQSNGRGN